MVKLGLRMQLDLPTDLKYICMYTHMTGEGRSSNSDMDRGDISRARSRRDQISAEIHSTEVLMGEYR